MDLARGIAELLSDETRRRIFGNNCRSIALTEYSASSVAARHLQLYEALAAENAAPAGAVSARQPSSRLQFEKARSWFSPYHKASGK